MKLVLMTMMMVVLTVVSTEGFAKRKSACRKRFESNLLAIKSKACRTLSKSCWAQVRQGRSNGSSILSACSDKEVEIAKKIEWIEGKNVGICQAGCMELERKGVCVPGLPKATYFKRLRLNPGCVH